MEVEDSAHLHLDFGGLFATLDVSWCVQASRNGTCEVYGEHGTLSGDPTYANTPIHIFRPGSGWTVEEPTSRWPREDDWVQGVAHLVDCVRHNTAPVNSATHARHVLDIMLTALRSAREGRALALSSSGGTSTGRPANLCGTRIICGWRTWRSWAPRACC